MTLNDKIRFQSMMDTLTSVYQKQPLDQNSFTLWFYKLEKFEFNILKFFKEFWKFPMSFDKIKLLLIMITPNFVLKRLKNFKKN